MCPVCSWDQPSESRQATVGCWVWCSLVLSRHTHTHSGPGSAQAEPAPQNPEPSVNRMIEFKGR